MNRRNQELFVLWNGQQCVFSLLAACFLLGCIDLCVVSVSEEMKSTVLASHHGVNESMVCV